MNTHTSLFPIFCLSMLFAQSLSAEWETYERIVVGGGLAGLTAAYRLQEAGYEVEIFECRGRVGGRVLSASLNGRTIELGGHNLTDGGTADEIRALIDELDLTVVEETYTRTPWHFSIEGTLVDPNPLIADYQFDRTTLMERLEKIGKEAEHMGQVLEQLFGDKSILISLFGTELAAYEGASAEKLSTTCINSLYHMLFVGSWVVSPVYAPKDSAVEPDRTCVSVKGGNALIAEELAKRLEGHIHLNKQLKRVERDDKGYYVLSFQDGETVRAEILILALPCPVYADIEFTEEAVPAARLEAMKKIAYGTNAKILVPVEKTDVHAGSYLTDRMIAFQVSTQDPVIMYYVNDCGTFTSETIAAQYATDRTLVELAHTIKTDMPDVTFAQDIPFATYEGPVGYSWPDDPYVKGSYSYMRAGQEELFTTTEEYAGETVTSLFKPQDDTLFWAGEHTTKNPDNLGTMEAAVESGNRTARMVIKTIESKQQKEASSTDNLIELK